MAKNIRKIVVNEEVGDTGRYNFGQKCVFWAAIILLVLLLVSGVIIWRPYFAPAFSIPVIRFALMLHSFAAVALIVVIMVHIYAALLGERHHYRDGGRLGYQNVGEETSPALVPRGPPETGKVI
ncbi:formate dehydrogenase O subunit gamma [Klebsiella variicola]|uniref:Formate dehydrogenase O subunit gamma n=1 Tax=Klebsiella variicola TaxID=244366 RepID=A0A7H4MAH2_KLEVA|nr:formate dehydrogenase O subunit gamma [Klebsiella variicola]